MAFPVVATLHAPPPPPRVHPAAPSITAQVTSDTMALISSQPITTTATNEVLVAFGAQSAPGSYVSGGGLTWTAVNTEACGGTSNVAIWWALAPSVITNQVITLTGNNTFGDGGSITIAAFKGADTGGAVGASNIACSAAGGVAPSSTLTTTRNNSWVWAAGLDDDVARARTIGAGQTMVSDYQDTTGGTAGDYWVQRQTAVTAASGTAVTSNDTAPITGPYDMVSVEILAPIPGTTPPTLDFTSTYSSLNSWIFGVTSPAISTTQPNEVLVAQITSGNIYQAGAHNVDYLNGGGLQWTKANSPGATALTDVWYAVAFSPVTNIQVTGVFGYYYLPASITVTAWTGLDLESPIGAVATAGTTGGAPAVSLTTTRAGSWVWGQGVDVGNAAAPSVGAGQTLDHQEIDTVDAQSCWTQHETATTPVSGTVVTLSDTAPTADQWQMSAFELMPAVAGLTLAQTGESGPLLDAFSTAPFSTTHANELLVAFVAQDSPDAAGNLNAYASVSGAGLSWTRVTLNNGWPHNGGYSGEWWAIAPSPLSNAVVTLTNEDQSTVGEMLTVEGFTGEDLSNPIGMVTTDTNTTGAETVSVTTTRNNAWVWGVGEDWGNAAVRTATAGQTIVDQNTDTRTDATYWVQSQSAATATAGTVVPISDSAPTVNSWALSAIEILPPAASPAVTADIHVSASNTAVSTSHVSTPISTASPNQLLVLSVATDNASGSGSDPVVSVSGGGLAWTKATSVAAQTNSAEIWWANAPVPVANLAVTVTTTFGDQSPLLELTSWSGASLTSPIGATQTANGATGVPTAAVTTTAANSVVMGVGADDTSYTSHTASANQILRDELRSNDQSDGWTQHPVTRSASGTVVAISDTSLPDKWDLAVAEIVPGTPSTTTLTSAADPLLAGNTVGYTATVTPGAPTPGGTISFTDNGTVITGCSAIVLSFGAATCTTPVYAAAGGHAIVATYAGGGTYNPSVSNTLIEEVYPSTGATAFAWGDNSQGQLGDGTLLSRQYRMPVATLGATVTQISGNYYAAAAIDTSGNAWVWGYNNQGQSGSGANPTKTPFKIIGTGNVVAITMSGSDNGSFGHAIALESDGSVWTWGDDTYGELGNNTSDSLVHATPTKIAGLTAVAVTTTFFGDAVLTSAGAVWTWGGNGDGELGNSTVSCGADPCLGSMVPVAVATVANVTSLSGDGESYLAVESNGTVFAWGRNTDGQLGNGGAGAACGVDTCETSPVQSGSFSDGASAHMGRHDAYVITTAGLVRDWGGNYRGELGNGTMTKQTTPVTMAGVVSPLAVVDGYDATVVVMAGGGVRSIGYNTKGELGDGTTTNRSALVAVKGITGGQAASTGWYSSYALGTSSPFTPSVTVTSAPNASVPTQSVTYTATVAGIAATPTGVVVFTDNGATICGPSVALTAGVATCSQVYGAVGSHAIVATYSGDAAYASAASTDIRWGFEDDGLDNWTVQWCCGGSLSNSITQANTGTHSLAIAVYGGTVGHNSCTGGDPLAGADPCNPGIENITDVAGVVGGTTATYHVWVPAAAVTAGVQMQAYYDDTSWTEHFATAVAVVSGWNTVSQTIPTGTASVNGFGIEVNDNSHWTGTIYLDDISLTYTQSVVVASTATVVATSATPSTYDTTVTFSATVSFSGGTPSPGAQEYVSFKDGPTVLGTGFTNTSGVATFTTSLPGLSVGAHTVTATYSGTDGVYPTSSGSVSQTVNGGVLTVAAPGPLSLPLTPGAPSPATGLGGLTFINTLGDQSSWSVTLGATDLCNGAVVAAPFADITVTVDQAPVGGGDATGTLTPGGASQTLSGPDTTPCATFSSGTATLATGTANAGDTGGTAGTWTMASNKITYVALGTATPGSYTGTIQYTITG